QRLDAYALDRALHTLAAAIAAVLRRVALQYTRLHAAQHAADYRLRPAAGKLRHGRHGGDVSLQRAYGVIRRAGHKLHEESSGGQHGLVRIYEHAEAACGRDLLALAVIGGEVLGYLAADEFG